MIRKMQIMLVMSSQHKNSEFEVIPEIANLTVV